MVDLSHIDTVQKAYAHHNRLHAEYLDARHAARKKAAIAEEHEECVKLIISMGGRHLAKGEALDETLPQELREAVKLRFLCDNITLAEDNHSPRVQIMRTGTFFHSVYGKFVITDETLDNMVHNFATVRPVPPTEMAVDYEHEMPESKMGTVAAGWVKGLFKENGGLFCDVEWTEEAAQLIRDKKFRFTSPEFDLNYRDKETNKTVGPTLLYVALTNKPFLEGMEPIMLSESLARLLCVEESFEERSRTIRDAYNAQYRTLPAEMMASYHWVIDVYDDYCVVEREGKLFKLPYTTEEGEVTFHKEQEAEVQKIYQEIRATEEQLKEWTTAYINDLPDSSFAYIRPGGEKDEEGRTKPRALRYLPFKDDDGKVDLPHLRNALARLPQTKLTPEEKAKARAVLVAAAKEAGVGEYETREVIDMALEQELREALGVDESVNLLDMIKKLHEDGQNLYLHYLAGEQMRTEHESMQKQMSALEDQLKQLNEDKALREASAAVEEAIQKGKLVPAQRDQAVAYALRDPSGFMQFIEQGKEVLELGERGGDGGEGAKQLSEEDRKVISLLGVSEEAFVKAKEEATIK